MPAKTVATTPNTTAAETDTAASVPGITVALDTADTTAEAALSPEPEPNDPNRIVKIKLHKDKNSGKGLFVSVNNHRFFIPRGVVVEVPYYIAAVVENMAAQDENTARMIEALTEDANF